MPDALANLICPEAPEPNQSVEACPLLPIVVSPSVTLKASFDWPSSLTLNAPAAPEPSSISAVELPSVICVASIPVKLDPSPAYDVAVTVPLTSSLVLGCVLPIPTLSLDIFANIRPLAVKLPVTIDILI